MDRIGSIHLFVIFDVISLALQHPTTVKGNIDLKNELQSIKNNIDLLYAKLNKLSAATKAQKNLTRSSLKDHKICLSKQCIENSYQLLKNMDLDADPCDDFYKYSCGNFIKEQIIPDDKKKWTSFSPLEDISKLLQKGSRDVHQFNNTTFIDL